MSGLHLERGTKLTFRGGLPSVWGHLETTIVRRHRLGRLGLVGCCGRGASHSLDIGGVDDCDRLGVLVLLMVLLCVDLFMLLEILGPFEGLFADLERNQQR